MSERWPASGGECNPAHPEALALSEIGRLMLADVLERDVTPEAIVRRNAMIEHFTGAYAQLDNEYTLLRAHQIDAIDSTFDFLTQTNDSDIGLTKRGIVAHAPGAGKSIYGAFLTDMLGVGKQLVDGQPPIRCLYLTNELKGLGQMMGNTQLPRGYAKATPWLHIEQLKSGRKSMPKAPIAGMTYQALIRRMKSHPEFFEGIDVVIADECPAMMGPEAKKAMMQLLPGKITIGLSGSPRRAYELLPERIHNISFREGVETRGILNTYVLYKMNTGQEITSTFNSDKEFKASTLERARTSTELFESAKRQALLFAQNDYKCIIYTFPGDESRYAQRLAAAISDERIVEKDTDIERYAVARPIGAFQHKKVNEEIFEDFDAGKIDILTTTRMGEIAWDPARLDAIILICPTGSLDALVQRLGRGSRPGDKPTVIIHFDYNNADQVTPYDVFGLSPMQGAVLRSRAGHGSKGRQLRDGDVINIQQQEAEYDLVDDPDFRPIDGLLDLLEESERHLLKRKVVRRYKHSPVIFEDATTTALLAAEHNLNEQLLITHLRRAKWQIASTSKPGGGREVFCEAEPTRTFIREQIAAPNMYTTAQMANLLGMSQVWVQKYVDQSEAEDRYPRYSIDEQRAPYFKEEVFMGLIDRYERTCLPQSSDEVSAVELARLYDVDLSTVYKWFDDRAIAGRMRRLNSEEGHSGICYECSYEAAFAWSREVLPLPKDKKYRTIASAFDASPVLRRMGHEQRVEVMRQAGVRPKRYRRHTNTNYFISDDEFAELRAVANQTPVEPDEVISPAESAARLVEWYDKFSFYKFSQRFKPKTNAESRPKRAICLPFKDDELLQTVRPIEKADYKKYVPLGPLAYRLGKSQPIIVRTVMHTLFDGRDNLRRNPEDGGIYITEHAASYIKSIFRDKRNKGVMHSDWPTVIDVVQGFDLDSDKVQQWIDTHEQSRQLARVHIKNESLVFCSRELVAFFLRNFKKQPAQTE